MYKRDYRGAVLVETPLALWILFVLFTVPFIDLASVMLRYTFVVSASRDAAHAAGKAKSFMNNLTASEPSAINLSKSAANTTASAFSEITVLNVSTKILITDILTRKTTTSAAPLSQPADTSANLYQFETTVEASINPLVPFAAGPMAGIPGLSAPIRVSVSSREFCENPQGLVN